MKQEVADYVTKCLACQQVKAKSEALKAYKTFTTLGQPRVEIGLGHHGLYSRLTTHPEEEQRNLAHRGLTHEDGSPYSHKKHMDLRPIGPSLPR